MKLLGRTGIKCVQCRGRTHLYKFTYLHWRSWVKCSPWVEFCVFLWGISRTVLIVSFFPLVGAFAKVCSDQITLTRADSGCVFACACSHVHVFLLIRLVTCAQSSSFPQLEVFTPITHEIQSLELNHMCVSVHFTRLPWTLFYPGSDYDGPLSHARCRHIGETQTLHAGCLFHVYFHRSASFHLLPFRLSLSSALSCKDELACVWYVSLEYTVNVD